MSSKPSFQMNKQMSPKEKENININEEAESNINFSNASSQILEQNEYGQEILKARDDNAEIDVDLDPLGLGLSLNRQNELSEEQLARLKILQNPNAMYDEQGNLL